MNRRNFISSAFVLTTLALLSQPTQARADDLWLRTFLAIVSVCPAPTHVRPPSLPTDPSEQLKPAMPPMVLPDDLPFDPLPPNHIDSPSLPVSPLLADPYQQRLYVYLDTVCPATVANYEQCLQRALDTLATVCPS